MKYLFIKIFLSLFFASRSFMAESAFTPLPEQPILYELHKNSLRRPHFSGNSPSFEEFMEKGYLVHTGEFARGIEEGQKKPSEVRIKVGPDPFSSHPVVFWTLNHLVPDSSFWGCGTAIVKLKNIWPQVVSVGFHEVMTIGDYVLKEGDTIILSPGRCSNYGMFLKPSFYDAEETLPSKDELINTFSRSGIDLYFLKKYDDPDNSFEHRERDLPDIVEEILKKKQGWVVAYEEGGSQRLRWHLTQKFLVDQAAIRNDIFFESLLQSRPGLSLGHSGSQFIGYESSCDFLWGINSRLDQIISAYIFERLDEGGTSTLISPLPGDNVISSYAPFLPLYPDFYRSLLKVYERLLPLTLSELNVPEQHSDYLFKKLKESQERMGLALPSEGFSAFFRRLSSSIKNNAHSFLYFDERFFFKSYEEYEGYLKGLYKYGSTTSTQKGFLVDQLEEGWDYFLINVVNNISKPVFDQLKKEWKGWQKLSPEKRQIVNSYFYFLEELKKRSSLWTYEVEPLPLSRPDLATLQVLPNYLKIRLYIDVFKFSLSLEIKDFDHGVVGTIIQDRIEDHIASFIQNQELLHNQWALVPWKG